jgi:hypothetical protein
VCYLRRASRRCRPDERQLGANCIGVDRPALEPIAAGRGDRLGCAVPRQLTLRRDDSGEDTILDAQVAEMAGTGMSMMPEGFEETRNAALARGRIPPTPPVSCFRAFVLS